MIRFHEYYDFRIFITLTKNCWTPSLHIIYKMLKDSFMLLFAGVIMKLMMSAMRYGNWLLTLW